MFLSDTHLPNILPRERYLDPAYLRREIDAAFVPGWHMVGSTQDFPRDGDFLKLPLFGREVIVWRSGDDYHAFLNVCPHRFCAITDADQGCSPERLRCQYHGWEFDGSGCTRKIPDAPSFRPLSKGAVGLTRFHLERVGQILFVSLAANPKPLKEWLGPCWNLIDGMFQDPFKQVWAYAPVCEGNWKEAVEVTLEGYHVIATHEKTLGQYPLVAEERCTNELTDDEHSCFRANHENDTHSIYKVQKRIARLCGWSPDLTWHHYHAYPNFGIVLANAHAVLHCVIPISVDRYINLHRIFTRKSKRKNLISRIVAHFNGDSIYKLAQATLAEDLAMIASHHRGLSTPELPQGGLISRREERVFHFQKFVDRLHAGVVPDGVAVPGRAGVGFASSGNGVSADGHAGNGHASNGRLENAPVGASH